MPDLKRPPFQNLSGEIQGIVCFLNDGDSSRSQEETETFFTSQIQPGLQFSRLYRGTVIQGHEKEGFTHDAMEQTASALGYGTHWKMAEMLTAKYSGRERVYLSVVRKTGCS